jgi:hypothetical protein
MEELQSMRRCQGIAADVARVDRFCRLGAGAGARTLSPASAVPRPYMACSQRNGEGRARGRPRILYRAKIGDAENPLPTFSDALAAVHSELWAPGSFETSSHTLDG